MLIKSPMVTVGISPHGKPKALEQRALPSPITLDTALPVASQESSTVWRAYGLKFGGQSSLLPTPVQKDLRACLLEQGYSSQCFQEIQKLLPQINRELEIPIQGLEALSQPPTARKEGVSKIQQAVSSGNKQIRALERFDAEGQKRIEVYSVKTDLGHGYSLTKALSREYQDSAIKRERTFISLHTAINDKFNDVYIHAVLQQQPTGTQPKYTIILQPRPASLPKAKLKLETNANVETKTEKETETITKVGPANKIETDVNTNMGFQVTLKPEPTDRIAYSAHYKFSDLSGLTERLLEYLPDHSKNIKNLMISHDAEDQAPEGPEIVIQRISHISPEGQEFILTKEYAVLPNQGLTLSGVRKYRNGKEEPVQREDIEIALDAELTEFYNDRSAA